MLDEAMTVTQGNQHLLTIRETGSLNEDLAEEVDYAIQTEFPSAEGTFQA